MLTPLERAFVAEYLRNGNNGTRAALVVWPHLAYEYAATKAGKMLAREDVKVHLSEVMRSQTVGGLLTMEERRQFLADLTRADPRSVMAEKPHLAQEVRITRKIAESGEVEETVQIKLPSKIQGLMLDAKLAGDLRERVEVGPLNPLEAGLEQLMGLALPAPDAGMSDPAEDLL